MVSLDFAWRMPEGAVADQRAENRCSPNEAVSVEDLRELGVLHWRLDPATMLVAGDNGKSRVDQICDEMGYKNRDQVTCSPDKLPEYDKKLAMFFQEHIHEDDEIRLILGGVGYFDVRDRADRWIRIRMTAGDLIVLPAGIYHRFTMDSSDYTQAMRLFKEVPVWTPINRPCDENEIRKQYVDKYFNNPAKPHTIVGEHDGAMNLYVGRAAQFDGIMRELVSAKLRPAHRDALVMYFTGVHNPVSNKSWCPDCVDADPVVATAVHKARALHPDRKVIFVEVAIERTTYLNNPEHPLRQHPFVQLASIPTLIVAAARPPTDTDEPGIDVVDRMENVSDAWIAKLPEP